MKVNEIAKKSLFSKYLYNNYFTLNEFFYYYGN